MADMEERQTLRSNFLTMHEPALNKGLTLHVASLHCRAE